jgi:uncharacterized protein (DUF2235 family)
MGKNIIICSDGTGATAAKNRGTNVFKLYEAVELHDHKMHPGRTQQIAFYDDGVGTQGVRFLRILCGAFGLGLSRNVRELYAELVRSYEPGDQIYLFGFSRGAFTVRTLAGLIFYCGILKRSEFGSDERMKSAVAQVYETYRTNHPTSLQLFVDGMLGRRRAAWRKRRAARDAILERSHSAGVRIRFIGVWDTVDAVGVPSRRIGEFLNSVVYRFKFRNYRLSNRVDRACQALAIDDERVTFHPLMWRPVPDDADRITQVWFAGVHSNVGGGYPRQGMSLVTLDWMMARAEEQDLRFVPSVRDEYRRTMSTQDKLYDSRGGLAVLYPYRPRDIWRICRCTEPSFRLGCRPRHGLAGKPRPTERPGQSPEIHLSVLERIAQQTDGYAPGNIPRGSVFVGTTGVGSSPPVKAEYVASTQFLDNRLDEWRVAAGRDRTLRTEGGRGSLRALLHLVPGSVRTRAACSYIRVVAVGTFALQLLVSGWWPSCENLQGAAKELWFALLRGAPQGILAGALVLTIVASAILEHLVRRRMEREFSEFWHTALRSLRGTL